jgi:hypothetical protein
MSSESVCQVARSWVDVGSFHTRLFGVVYSAIASVREFLDTPSYIGVDLLLHPYLRSGPGSSDGIATEYGLDGPGIECVAGGVPVGLYGKALV